MMVLSLSILTSCSVSYADQIHGVSAESDEYSPEKHEYIVERYTMQQAIESELNNLEFISDSCVSISEISDNLQQIDVVLIGSHEEITAKQEEIVDEIFKHSLFSNITITTQEGIIPID